MRRHSSQSRLWYNAFCERQLTVVYADIRSCYQCDFNSNSVIRSARVSWMPHTPKHRRLSLQLSLRINRSFNKQELLHQIFLLPFMWWTRRCSAHVRKIRRRKRCWQSWLTDHNSDNLLSFSVLLRKTQKLFNLLNKIKYRFYCDYTTHASLKRCP